MTKRKTPAAGIFPVRRYLQLLFLLITTIAFAQPSWEDGDDVNDEHEPEAPIHNYIPLLAVVAASLGCYVVYKKKPNL